MANTCAEFLIETVAMLGALTVIYARRNVPGLNWHTAEHSFWLGRSARKMFPKFSKTVGILSLSIVVVLLGRVFGETVLASLPQFVQRLRPRIEVTSNDRTIAFIQKYYFEINLAVLIGAVIAFIMLKIYRDRIKACARYGNLKCTILAVLSPFVFCIYCKVLFEIVPLHKIYVCLILAGFTIIVALISVHRSKARAAATPAAPRASEPEATATGTPPDGAPDK